MYICGRLKTYSYYRYVKSPSDCSGVTSFTIAAAACVTDQQYLATVKHAYILPPASPPFSLPLLLPLPFLPAPTPAPPPFSPAPPPAPPFPLFCRNNMCSSIMPFVSTCC